MLNRHLLLILGPALALAPRPALPHEHWVDAADLTPRVGQEVAVWLASGHHFPESDTVIADRLIDRLVLRKPGRPPEPVATEAQDRRRAGAVRPDRPGAHLLELVLRRPPRREPEAYARAILFVSSDEPDADGTVPATGEGLELVPLRLPHTLPDGEELRIELRRDGEPVAGVITYYAGDSRPRWVRATATEPARLKVTAGTRYLFASAHQGQSVTLVFQTGAP